MKKLLLAAILALLSNVALAQQAVTASNTTATKYNQWYQGTGVQALFGAYPNATEYYDGTNLVIDVTHGGGKVSIPDGVTLGTGSLTLGSSLIFDGSTVDSIKTTLTVVDPTSSSKTITLPNQTGAVILSVGGVVDSANAISGGTGTLIFEGTTADSFETTIGVVDPTADQTWNVPNFAVNAAFLGSTLTTNTIDAANSIWAVSNGLKFEGATADAFETTIAPADPTASRTITLPDASGTVAVTGGLTAAAGANTACTTTCGAGKCYIGFDAGTSALVACSSALADSCLCLP